MAIYAPTVLTELTPSASTYTEEFFGPVAILFRARNIDEAIRLANDTPFGLGASVCAGGHDKKHRSGFRWLNRQMSVRKRVKIKKQKSRIRKKIRGIACCY